MIQNFLHTRYVLPYWKIVLSLIYLHLKSFSLTRVHRFPGWFDSSTYNSTYLTILTTIKFVEKLKKRENSLLYLFKNIVL